MIKALVITIVGLIILLSVVPTAGVVAAGMFLAIAAWALL